MQKMAGIVLTLLLIVATLAIQSSQAPTISIAQSNMHQVPLSPYDPESNKQWYLYECSGYSPCTSNCGPASAAMVINYLRNKHLQTTNGTFNDASIPDVHCTARGYYCQTYLKNQGEPSAIWNNGYYDSDWSIPGALDYQIQNALSLQNIKSHVILASSFASSDAYLQAIEAAIDQGSLCIAGVKPSEYQLPGITYNGSHWTVVYGYDDANIYLNDPGWIRFQNDPPVPVPESAFANALWNVESAFREVIIVDTTWMYNNSATVTDIPNPDAYSCSQPGYVDFEAFPDETNISSQTIAGMLFKTTGGYSWLVSDTNTGKYNGKYPHGAYMCQGTHSAWLGPNQGSGEIDFTEGLASYFSLLVSDYTPVYLDAYGSSGNLLATAGPSPSNLNTGHMTELKITRTIADMAYVVVHDAGNYFIIDCVCTNAPETPNKINGVVDETYFMQTGQHVSGNFVIDSVPGAQQYLHIFVGPFASDVDLNLTRPDGSVVSPSDPGVTYDKTTNSIEVSIEDALAGQWGYEIIANQLEAGGENIHIVAQEEAIPDTTPPTTTIALDPASPDGCNGWYISPVRVTLTAQDNPGGSRVAYTEYSLDGGTTWQTYSGPFTVSVQGTDTVLAYSVDNAGNVETPSQSATFKIDLTPPQVAMVAPPDGATIHGTYTFAAKTTDGFLGATQVGLYIRGYNGTPSGIPIGYDNLAMAYNAGTGNWEYLLNTNSPNLPDGCYVAFGNASDIACNWSLSAPVRFIVHNWVVTQVGSLPMPPVAGVLGNYMFSVKVAPSVNPTQPKVLRSDFVVKIFATSNPGNILQTYTYAGKPSTTGYWYDPMGVYHVEFQPSFKPMQYTIAVYTSCGSLIGQYNFSTR